MHGKNVKIGTIVKHILRSYELNSIIASFVELPEQVRKSSRSFETCFYNAHNERREKLMSTGRGDCCNSMLWIRNGFVSDRGKRAKIINVYLFGLTCIYNKDITRLSEYDK